MSEFDETNKEVNDFENNEQSLENGNGEIEIPAPDIFNAIDDMDDQFKEMPKPENAPEGVLEKLEEIDGKVQEVVEDGKKDIQNRVEGEVFIESGISSVEEDLRENIGEFVDTIELAKIENLKDQGYVFKEGFDEGTFNAERNFLIKSAANKIDKIIETEIESELKNNTRLHEKLGDLMKGLLLDSGQKNLLDDIKSLDGASFLGYTIEANSSRFSRMESINEATFLLRDNKEKVGRLGAFVSTSEKDKRVNLYVLMADIEDEYRGSGIMRRFYLALQDKLEEKSDEFGALHSDQLFTLNDEGKAPGLRAWNYYMENGLAEQTGEGNEKPTEMTMKKFLEKNQKYLQLKESRYRLINNRNPM